MTIFDGAAQVESDLLRALADATHRRNAAQEEWNALIRRAVAAGVPVTAIAAVAGVSRRRVYQIRDDNYGSA